MIWGFIMILEEKEDIKQNGTKTFEMVYGSKSIYKQSNTVNGITNMNSIITKKNTLELQLHIIPRILKMETFTK